MADVAFEKKVRIIADVDVASAKRADSILAQIGSGNTSIAGLTAALNNVSGAAGGAGRAASAANDNFASMGASASHASGGILEMVKHLGTMTLALAGIGFLTAGIHELAEGFIEAADHATEAAGRLALVTNGTKEFAEAQANVVSISNQTRASLTDTAELYQKIGIQAGHLGASQKDVTTMTKTFAETLKVSAATTQQSQAAMRQLGEAFDMNGLQGRHFIALQSDNVRFMQLLAASMGVTQGKLKELATDGKVTGEELKKALTDPKLAADLQKQFDKMPVGFADVRMSIKNTLVQLAGDFMEGSGLNNSLRSLYNRIAQFGTDAGPAFQKIGAAARAAFEAFAPMAGAAIDAIKPVFAFVLDNGPQLIQLLKVGAEVWIAYAAAQRVALAVSLAEKFVVEAQSLAMFLDLARGGTGAVGLLKGVFLLASEGVNTFTASLLANPFTALAVGITAVVGLLYEFRDSITLGGGSLTTLGDLFRAAWETIGPAVQNALGYVEAFGSWISDKLGPLASWAKDALATMFGGVEFGIGPALRGIGVFADNLIMVMRYGYTAVASIWNNLPGMMAQAFAAAANSALDKLETLGNGARSILNGIITGMNSVFHTSIGQVGEIKIPRINVANAAGQVAADLKAVTNSRTVETAMNGLISRADQIGAARRAAGAAKPGATGALPTPHADADSGDDDKDAKKKANQIKEFWNALKGQLETAKSFGIELARQTEELKLHKILDHDLSADQKSAVYSLVDQVEAAKQLTEVNKSTFDLHNKNLLLQGRAKGLTDDQAKIEDALDVKRLSALDMSIDINSRDYKLALDKYRAELLINQALEKQVQSRKDAAEFAKKYSPAFAAQSEVGDMAKAKDNFVAMFNDGQVLDQFGKPITQTMYDSILKGYDKALQDAKNKPFQVAVDYGNSAIKDFGTDQDKRDLATKTRNSMITGLNDAKASGAISSAAFAAGVRKAGDDFDKAIQAIGTAFGRSMTALADVFDQLGTAIGGKVGSVVSGVGGISKSLGSFGDTQAKISDDISTAFGKDSDLAKSIGDKVGSAIAGLETGNQVSSLMTSLGIQGSKTGAQVGGAIGGLAFGPLGALGGSLLGGLISSIFSSPDHSNGSFTRNADGSVGVGASTGTTGQLRQAATGAAGDVLTGLANIASQIGGTLTGIPNLTIGTWNNKWRVLDNQQTGAGLNANNFSMGSNLHDFGSDEASAVAYAIAEALKQGVITGLSGLAQKALAALDSDSAISFIQQWTKTMADYKAVIDPIGSAVDGIVTPMNALLATMNKVGASTDDLTKLQNAQTVALKKALDAQLSTLNSLMKTLNGEGSGKTALARLTDDLTQFDSFKSRITAGDTTIDQQDYSSLVTEIQSLVGTVYGTSTSQGQDILSSLSAATTAFESNITTQFNNDAGYDVTAADNQITAALSSQTAQTVISNAILQQIANNTAAANYSYTGGGDTGGGDTVSANDILGKNGEYLGLTY